jgi:hypothetical protein
VAKVRIGREEMDSIVAVADRMAKRRYARFVIDPQRVEIVERADSEKPADENCAQETPAIFR